MTTPTMNYIMVFDFETTGLPKKSWDDYRLTPTFNMRTGNMIPASIESDFPHSVQLSYILYNTEKNTAKVVDEIIRLPMGVTITKESESIHHISLEKTQGKTRKVKNRRTGRFRLQHNLTIEEVLRKFMVDFRKANVVVSHNIQFDKNMLLVEMDRIRKNPKKEIFNDYIQEINVSTKMYCTARNGAYVCKIKAINCIGREYYKIPKLTMLYTTLFHEKLNEDKLHNALYDVVLCLRSFCKMKFNIDIYDYNETLRELIDDVTINNKAMELDTI